MPFAEDHSSPGHGPSQAPLERAQFATGVRRGMGLPGRRVSTGLLDLPSPVGATSWVSAPHLTAVSNFSPGKYML